MLEQINGPKFLLAGNGPYANRGCEAIVRGTVELLSKKFDGASFILSSLGSTLVREARNEVDPHIEHRPHLEQMSCRRFSSKWWINKILNSYKGASLPFCVQKKAMSECACALMLGGDNYTLDYGRPTFFVDMDKAIMSTGKPIVLWGVSVGPFTKDPEFEKMMIDHLQSLDLILARETDTIGYLESIGVINNVKLVGDSAFLMSPKMPKLSSKYEKMLSRGAIGLNLSPLVSLYLKCRLENWKIIASKCVEALVKADLGSILLIPHVTIDTPIDDDYTFLVEVSKDIKGFGDKFDVLPPTFSAQEYKWVISKLNGFAGTRMHATIAALSSLVPTISIGYSRKSIGVNQDLFGHLDWLLPIDEICPELLVEKYRLLLRSKDSVKESLKTNLPLIINRAESAGDYIVSLVNNSLE